MWATGGKEVRYNPYCDRIASCLMPKYPWPCRQCSSKCVYMYLALSRQGLMWHLRSWYKVILHLWMIIPTKDMTVWITGESKEAIWTAAISSGWIASSIILAFTSQQTIVTIVTIWARNVTKFTWRKYNLSIYIKRKHSYNTSFRYLGTIKIWKTHSEQAVQMFIL